MKKMDGSSSESALAMEKRAKSAPEAAGFNRKRAEGRDESDRPKKLQLKVRTLNPANTICYVQVKSNGLFQFGLCSFNFSVLVFHFSLFLCYCFLVFLYVLVLLLCCLDKVCIVSCKFDVFPFDELIFRFLHFAYISWKWWRLLTH